MASVEKAGDYWRRNKIISETTALLTQQGSSVTPSIYRDLIVGKIVGADQMIGDLKAHVDFAGLLVPLMGVVWTHLSVYQQNRG